MTFTGTGFFTSGHTPIVKIGTFPASSVNVVSATSCTATFDKGVPVSATAITPEVIFNDTATGVFYYAQQTQTITKTLDVTASTSGLSCSFAGGCVFSISASGLASKIHNDSSTSNITVCEEECIYSPADSTAAEVKCKVPHIGTTYSNTQYEIEVASEDLKSGIFMGSVPNSRLAFDNNNLNNPGDTSANCFLGMRFRPGHIGLLSQVKFFLKNIVKTTYINNLKF